MMRGSSESYPHDTEVGYQDGRRPQIDLVKYGVGNNAHGSTDETPNSPRKQQTRCTLLVILLAIICFGLLAYILVSGFLGHLINPKGSKGFVGICDIAQCVAISHRSIESGDFSQDPCEDFFSFACSKWQQQNPPQDQLYSAANINKIKDDVDFYIKRLLERPEEMGVNETRQFHMHSSPKAFYESCLHFSSPQEPDLIQKLVEPLGGYKTVESWSDKTFDLTTTVLKFLKANAAPLFDLTLDIDPRDNSKYALIIELPRMTSLVPNLLQPMSRQEDVLISEKVYTELTEELPKNPNGFVLNATNNQSEMHAGNNEHLYPTTLDRQVLYKMIQDNVEAKRIERLESIILQIGDLMKLKKESVQSDAESIKVLATNVEKIKPGHRSRKFLKQQNKVYNAFTIETLQRLFGNIDWRRLLEQLLGKDSFGGAANFPDNFSWDNATIYVPYPNYMRRLSNVLQFTDKRIIENWILVMYVKDMLNDLNPKKKDDEPRWKFCVHSTKSVFALEISSLYMRSFDPTLLQDTKRDIGDIFNNVRQTLVQFLNQSSWQDEKTKEGCLKKVKAVQGNFIGPDFYLKMDYLEDRIKNEIRVQIDPKNFFGNVLLVFKIFRKQLYALYRKEIDMERATWAFVTFPTTVNAFYIQQFNSLVVPLAFLNPPHYIYGGPKYVNYATIALTIAHELLHAIDSSGSDFDANGKLNFGSQNSKTRGFLKEKSDCIAKQYFNTFSKIVPFRQANANMYYQVDGNLTQNENLADIAGLQVAFKAYQKLLLERKDDLELLKLPGLNFTRDQMFFVALSQAYCANISPMGYIFLLEMDDHTPHPERINGMLMNNPEFSQTFQCPAESRMNPVNKCSSW